jgi:hypothetical protein
MIGTGNKRQYKSIRSLFRLEFPEKWTLVGDNEGVATFSSPSGMAVVTVSAARHRSQFAVADACEQLQRYMKNLDIEPGRFKKIGCTIGFAAGEYTDHVGVYWRIVFKASANVIVFATYSRKSSDLSEDDDRDAEAILSSITVL